MLRAVVMQWLRQRAAAAAADGLAQATHTAGQAARNMQEAACVQVPIAVVAALGIELGGLEDRLQALRVFHGHGFLVRLGLLRNRPVMLVTTGVGPAAAAKAVDSVLAAHRPQWVVSAGFAGGLQPGLAHGDLVAPDALVDAAGRVLPVAAASLLPSAVAENLRGGSLRVGRLLSVDRLARTPQEKHTLAERHQALAVDMETFAVAEACLRQGVPMIPLRVITDAAEDELPRELDRLLQPQSAARRLGAALRAIVQRPSTVKDFYRLHETAVAGADRLAEAVETLVCGLLPDVPRSAAAE